MLFLLVRRDKPAGCLRIGVPHGEGLTTNGLLRFLDVRQTWGSMPRNVSFAKQAAEVFCQAVVVQRKCHPFSNGNR
jgi:hypothetical protein